MEPQGPRVQPSHPGYDPRTETGRIGAHAAPHPGSAATVTVYPDGPLVLRGEFAVLDVDGREHEAGRIVALCRCGRSAVKPWCDGSHRRGAVAT